MSCAVEMMLSLLRYREDYGPGDINIVCGTCEIANCVCGHTREFT